MWNLFKRKEIRQTLEEILIQGGLLTVPIAKNQVLNIPAVSACVDLISNTVASLPIQLYREGGKGRTEIVKDIRTELLNDDTKDTMDGFQFKRALVEDYLLMGGGYAYINRARNLVKSLHYVENQVVAVNLNSDPIFKKCQIQVNGEQFREFQFIKLIRKSKDGVTGKGIVKENNIMLSLAYHSIVFEESMVKTGGSKKGFLKSAGRLSKDAMDELKKGWKDLYGNNNENVLVLNNGLDFQEASQTSVEMQLNEQKKANSDEVCKIFLVPPKILSGQANDEEYNNWIKVCITPLLSAFETALNKDLLLPSEKEMYYFAFDTTELTKGDIEKRFKAYEIATKNGILQIDEVRYKENYAPLDLPFIKLGLQDVLLNVKTGEIYTPNTNQTAKIGSSGEIDTNQPNQNNSAQTNLVQPKEKTSAETENPTP